MTRVFVTGMGMVTPLGLDVETSWRALCDGHTAAQKISHFDASGWPVQIACEVKKFTLHKDAQAHIDTEYLNLPASFALQASFEAFQSAGLQHSLNPSRSGLIMGSGIGAIKPQEILEAFKDYDLAQGLGEIDTYLQNKRGALQHVLIKNHPATLNVILSERWQLGGRVQTASTACSSGAQAIGHGFNLIRSGQQDLMLVGGTDSLAGELLFAGFCLLGVMSQEKNNPQHAARPFDKDRSGFVAGEGAAVLLLESEDHLTKRGGRPICEIIGYGESENAYRITDLPHDGHGAIFAMQKAAQHHLGEIDCINTHGTATAQNDAVEALAIEKVFYDHGHRPWVTANKSQVGHFVAASGAVEAVFSILSLRDQIIPPMVNYQESDCSEVLRFVGSKARQDKLRAILSNSFGFGGTNSSLAFKAVSS